jgi:hypothetical protein
MWVGVGMLLTEVSAGKADEDGFEAGLGGGDVAEAVLVGGGDDFGEEAVDDAGEDAEAALDDFDAGDAFDGGEGFFEEAAIADAVHAEVVDDVAADAGFERSGRVFDEDFAVVDDGESVAEFVGLFHVVGGEDDGDAFAAEASDGFPHGDTALRIEAGAGLVEEEDLGMVGDGARDLQALGEASAEGLRIGCSAIAEAELFEELGGALGGGFLGHAEEAAMEVDVFEDGAGAVEGVVLRDDADGAASERGMRDDVDACDADGACGGDGAGGGDGDRGGLAGAIGTEQTVDQSRGNMEVDSIDRRHWISAAVHLAQP